MTQAPRPGRQRLKGRAAFRAVFATRCSVANDDIVMYIALNGLDVTRLGIRISRRFGRAVDRNRCKRRIREAWRLCGLATTQPGLDVVCLPRSGRCGDMAAYRVALPDLIAAARRRLARHRRTAHGPTDPRRV